MPSTSSTPCSTHSRATRPRSGRSTSSRVPVEVIDADQRDPSTDSLLLDADAEQEHVIAQIASGNSLVVTTMPGTGGTQTLVNALGALIQQGKRVLVVSPRRGSLSGIARRLTDIGLPGVAVSPRSLRRDLLRAISRNERASCTGRGGCRRSPRAAACGAARLPRSPHPARPGARGVGARLRLGTVPSRAAAASAGHDGAPLPRDGRAPRRRPGARRERDDRGREARRVPLRTRRLALVRRGVRERRRRRGRPPPREAAARRVGAVAARARAGTDRRDPDAAVRDDRRTRGLPAAARRHPRHPRPIHPRRVRPLTVGTGRRDGARAAKRPR